MATDVTLPELGENIEAGDVVKIFVGIGDVINVDQPIIEVETDKAAIEVPAPIAGKVESILIEEGQSAKVGQVILKVSESDDALATLGSEELSEESVPESASNGKRGTSPKDFLQRAVKEAPKKEAAEQQEEPEKIAKPAEPPAEAVDKPIPQAPAPLSHHIPAAPSVRRKAREQDIDLATIIGSGIDGRISANDLRGGQQPSTAPVSGGLPFSLDLKLPDFAKWGEVEKTKLSNVRRATAIHLSQTWATVPQVTHYDKADITDLDAFRKEHGEKAVAAGGKLTITSILLKVIASALEQFPQFNASIDLANEQLISKKYINVGVAVDTERGLLVPVIRNADQKNIIELSAELSELSKKARDKKLKIEEMHGGNFTISNLGGIGGVSFSPIVNSPEVAILGVARGRVEPVFRDGFFSPRTMVTLALSYDHRVIDGADAARFLSWVAKALEQPETLALES